MDIVEDRFLESTTVSANEMVLITEKGNPRKILTLADLANLISGSASRTPRNPPSATSPNGSSKARTSTRNRRGWKPQSRLPHRRLSRQPDQGRLPRRRHRLPQQRTGQQIHRRRLRNHRHRSPQRHRSPALGHRQNSDHKHLLTRFYKSAVSAKGKEKFLAHGFRWELN